MQHSDVSQHDWHPGQILCQVGSPASSSHRDIPSHAIFVDFSASTQTMDLDYELGGDDYGDCVRTIAHSSIAGLEMQWVYDYWMRSDMLRDDWDGENTAIFGEGTYVWNSERVDPYLFVYEEINKASSRS